MTKEEYARLLNSDYWKGFSYSLIKERNFTCEDCGRRFHNERNKLQVHHLVYRDINPWSYKPEEMVVLCEECHKKRHGLWTEPVQDSCSALKSEASGSYTKSYSYASEGKNEKANQQNTNYWGESKTTSDYRNTNIRHNFFARPYISFKYKYLLYGILFLCIVDLFIPSSTEKKGDDLEHIVNMPSGEVKREISLQTINEPSETRSKRTDTRHAKAKKQPNDSNNAIVENSKTQREEEPVNTAMVAQTESFVPEYQESEIDIDASIDNLYKELDENLSSLEELEKRNHADVVKRAERAGISTEGSTMEILERINHADVVKRAERAGVSTEGSTMEILERINHADVVKRAERAGVSTEGSTMEILERINHADVIKRAERAGVSTEGSTMEILERIYRKKSE